jgi:hypothetical protein
MPLVVFLRGLNVGGHRSFRPSVLARTLEHLDVVNIGATGIFVIRRPVGRTTLRAQIADRLPFGAEIMICDGGEILKLVQQDWFRGHPKRSDVVQFVSVLARRPRSAPKVPMVLPPGGPWMVRILARDGRFVIGLYRRSMKVIGFLNSLDRVFGVPATTRSLSTMEAIARVLSAPLPDRLFPPQ